MAYVNEGVDQRAEVLQGATDSLVYWPKRNGAVAAIDVATLAYVTLYTQSGGIIGARQAATQGSDGELVLSQAWLEGVYPLGEDFAAVWEWTTAVVVYSDRQYFDVVGNKLACLIDTRDLEELWPNLTNHLAAVGETDATKFIRRGWSYMLDQIRSGGNRPSLIMDKARLINPAVQLAAHFTAIALTRTVGDLWDKRADQCWEKWTKLFAGLGTLKYDRNEDTVVGDDDKKRITRRRFMV